MSDAETRKKCHECRQVMSEFTDWEQNFLRDMQKRSSFTEKQTGIIERLYEKACAFEEPAKLIQPDKTSKAQAAFTDGLTHTLYDREDELAHCKVCGGAEATLPKHCPNRRMTDSEETLVQAGRLNYINGVWVKT